ncbi:protein ALTERED XYLOGLUCAN 9-like [Cornus florida]|uniref:protein ALTERED XYLOGLUCAN 9-like n=1 Tax=Cornus florida TaxID=4283 RepID=UPI00289B6C7E|nr:protein ALTERED XYLOGLUCAN 9-like [Cornus florida]
MIYVNIPTFESTNNSNTNPTLTPNFHQMLRTLQFRVLAACVVLFVVPMAMAGWHLSRNKMLFFSGALFITLTVCVHLIPYLASISTSSSSFSSSSVLVLENRFICISLLHEIVFDVKPIGGIENLGVSSNYGGWNWSNSAPVVACGFENFGVSDALDMLKGSWVVVAGDSQARLVVVSLLSLVLGSEEMDSIRGDLFKRHSDYQIVIDGIGMKLDFRWAPYVMNLTDLMVEFKRNKNFPDVLVMGAGLWHMLHVTNSWDYGVSLRLLRDLVVSLVPASREFDTHGPGPAVGSNSIQSPHLFWLGMPMLINSMLNTEKKRDKMTNALRDAYDKQLYGSKLLHQSGGPFLLLNILSLSWKCGTMCTDDGMHYHGAVYEAAVHIMLNELLIESR